MKPHVPRLSRQKGKRKLTCLTGYDAFHARLLNASSVDMILVGDTLGLMVQGHESTLPVTLDEMIYHTRIVARCAPEKLVIADMPFGSIQRNVARNVENCVRVFKESGAGAIKIEGAMPQIQETVRQLTYLGVPVVGHIGFQPQSVHLSGYKIDGKDDERRQRLQAEASQLQDAGCFAIVLECVLGDVAQQLTEQLQLLTIGIGSGQGVDAQVLVLHDLLGMTEGRLPSFVRQYAEFRQLGQEAIERWIHDVQQGAYPNEQETYSNTKK
jgi:3-methyl-2-oxobutanoate hydroxymethyltransferase